jgi:hypothetical protein
MRNFLATYFFVLCILMLGGHGQLTACASNGPVDSSLSETSENSWIACGHTGEDTLPFVKKRSDAGDPVFLIDVAEITEEEEHHVSCQSSIVLFCALTRHYFFARINSISISADRLAEIPSHRRHLLLQVFRI